MKIAATLGMLVAGVMLLIWGATAIAGGVHGELKPTPTAASVVTPVTEASDPTRTAAATASITPKPATPATTAVASKPITAIKPRNTTPAQQPAQLVPPSATAKKAFVVVIDPGHQAKGDPRGEPIGPGSSTMKDRNTSGADGGTTGQHESMLNLQVALRVRDDLERRGVRVVMCRTTQDVVISNAERARMANDAHADLFLRVHADGVDDHSQHGFMTMVPASNQWWGGSLLSTSARAGGFVQKAAIAATGAKDRGITHRGDMTGFNWAKVPSVLVEMGFLSNPDEDRRMASAAYQAKLAEGITNGVMDYLNSSR